MEAKYVACYEAICKLCGQGILFEVHLVESIFKPLIIYCDNPTVVQEFQTCVEHIPTKLMVADPLIKGLAIKIYVDHVTHMGVVRSFDTLS
ncbi:hypothetical protein CR513_29491, partial [Mucuna pruriens]